MTSFKSLIFLSIIVFSITSLDSFCNNSEYEQAWEFFKTNDYDSAEVHFRAALDSDNPINEANLGLSFIDQLYNRNEKAFQHFLDFYHNSDEPDPYVFALWLTQCVNNYYNDKTEEQIDFLYEFAEDPNTNGTLKIWAYLMLARTYDQLGQFDEADENYNKVGAIIDWQFTGPFENISASGFDKDWKPIHCPSSDSTFLNDSKAPVKWFNVEGQRSGTWTWLSHHFYWGNSIIFAQTFCKSPNEDHVQLRIGTSGSLKIWVNDKLMFREPQERNNGTDTYIINIKLNKGYNRILLQLGESEVDNLNFLCRITDSNGNNIEGLEFKSEYSKETEYNRNYDHEGEQVPIFAEVYFEEKIEKDPESLLNYILLSRLFLLNGKLTEARKVLDKAKELAPNCSYLQNILALVYQRNDNRTLLSLTLNKLKEESPENPLSLELLFNEEFENENLDEAKKYLEKLKELYGDEEKQVLIKQIKILVSENNIEDAKDLIEKAYELYPYNTEIVALKAAMGIAEKNLPDVIEHLEDYLSERYNSDIVYSLMAAYFQTNNVDKGLELFDILLRINPISINHLNRKSEIHFFMGDYERSLEFIDKCTAIAPYVGSYWSDRGDVLKELGNIEEATESYEKAVLYDPYDYDTRDKLRRIKDQTPIFNYFEEPNVYEIFQNAPDKEDYPQDNSLVLVDDIQRVIYKTGGSEEAHYLAAKVFNPTGIDEFKEFYVPSERNQDFIVEKAQTLKKDGRKLDAEINKDMIVFTNLEVGDGIYVKYKFQNFQYGELQRHFWQRHYFDLFYPCLSSRFSLILPDDIKFNYLMVNSDLKPKISYPDEGLKKYVWEISNIESTKYQLFMPSLSDVGRVLHISSIPDWKFIAGWYDNISQTKHKVDYDVSLLTEKLFEGRENLSELDKARSIYEYIIKNIRYSYVPFRQSGLVPQKASKTINTRIGDCKDVSTLFVAMCKAVGIESELVLVNGRENGRKDLPLPTSEFEHCIANAKLDGKLYYVELTNDDNPFGAIYGSNYKAFALRINKKENNHPIYLEPETRITPGSYRKSYITIEDKNMTVSRETIRTGGMASIIRSSYQDVADDEIESMLKQAVGSDFSNIKIEEFNFDENLNNNSDTVTYSYTFSVDNALQKIAGFYAFQIPITDNVNPVDIISDPKRKYPVEYWMFDSGKNYYEEIKIEIPPDLDLLELPEAINHSCFMGDYSLDFKMSGNLLIISRELIIKEDYVPIEKYEEFSDFFKKVISSDKSQIAFKKK